MRNNQPQQSGNGLELLAQLGLLQDPVQQLTGLVSMMMQIQEADRATTRLGLEQQQLEQQGEYQQAGLNMKIEDRKLDLAQQQEEATLRRASMMTQMLSSGVEGMDPTAVKTGYEQAGFPMGLFGAAQATARKSLGNPLSDKLRGDIEGWHAKPGGF